MSLIPSSSRLLAQRTALLSWTCRHQRSWLSDTSAAAVSTNKASRSSATGLWDRLSSFMIGAGLSALVSQYYIYVEVQRGNMLMLEKQMELEKRMVVLEKKN